MRRVTVESTTLQSMGYEAASRTLEIEFQSGAVYRYLNVPAHVYRGLCEADSKGRYFNDQVRDQYEFQRAGPDSGIVAARG